MTYKDSSARLMRWSLGLQEYDFKIFYKPGRLHANVDALSRLPVLSVVPTALKSFDLTDELRDAQLRDKSLIYFRSGKSSTVVAQNGFLYSVAKLSKYESEGHLVAPRLVLPRKWRYSALYGCHDDPVTGGHLRFDKVYGKLRRRFWWPGMKQDITDYLRVCVECQKIKVPYAKNRHSGFLKSIPVCLPLEIVAADLVGPITPVSSAGHRYILVVTDHFTKYAIIIPLFDKTAKTVAEALFEKVFLHWGSPKRLLSDQGKEFSSELLKAICEVMQTKKIQTTSYHPQTDGHTERYNRTLTEMLTSYVELHPTDWHLFLPRVNFAYVTSIHASTKFTPFYLLHGFEANYPMDVSLNPSPTWKPSVQDYISSSLRSLQEARDLVTKTLQKEQTRQAHYYNLNKSVPVSFSEGDLVLQEIKAKSKTKNAVSGDRQSSKISFRYEGPFEVIEKRSDLNYVIRDPARPRKKRWTVHIARLKPFHAPCSFGTMVLDTAVAKSSTSDDDLVVQDVKRLSVDKSRGASEVAVADSVGGFSTGSDVSQSSIVSSGLEAGIDGSDDGCLPSKAVSTDLLPGRSESVDEVVGGFSAAVRTGVSSGQVLTGPDSGRDESLDGVFPSRAIRTVSVPVRDESVDGAASILIVTGDRSPRTDPSPSVGNGPYRSSDVDPSPNVRNDPFSANVARATTSGPVKKSSSGQPSLPLPSITSLLRNSYSHFKAATAIDYSWQITEIVDSAVVGRNTFFLCQFAGRPDTLWLQQEQMIGPDKFRGASSVLRYWLDKVLPRRLRELRFASSKS